MNKAGAGVAQAVTRFFQKPGRCIVFAGKGHNAGDALFAAQCLERRGWKIEGVRITDFGGAGSNTWDLLNFCKLLKGNAEGRN